MVRNSVQGQKCSGRNLTSGSPAGALCILKHLKNFKGPGMVTATPFAKMLERKQPLPLFSFFSSVPCHFRSQGGGGGNDPMSLFLKRKVKHHEPRLSSRKSLVTGWWAGWSQAQSPSEVSVMELLSHCANGRNRYTCTGYPSPPTATHPAEEKWKGDRRSLSALQVEFRDIHAFTISCKTKF